jgi:hypothetical protein
VIRPIKPFGSFCIQVSELKNLLNNAVHFNLSEVIIQIIYDVSLFIVITSGRERNLER